MEDVVAKIVAALLVLGLTAVVMSILVWVVVKILANL